MRGFDTRNDMFIDGVRDSGVTTRETFNVEQVDVVKGPSGSISGRGATGGAINVVTKKPLDRNFANIGVEFGNAQQKRTTSTSITTSTSPGRFASTVSSRIRTCRDAPRPCSTNATGRPAPSLQASDSFKLTLDGYYMKFDQMPDWGVPSTSGRGVPSRNRA